MSLKQYQNLWLNALYSPPLALSDALSEHEKGHLQNWHEAHPMHQAIQEQTLVYFYQQLPPSVKKLARPDRINTALLDFFDVYKHCAAETTQQVQIQLLRFLADYPEAGTLHFAELCRYEAHVKSLDFYQLPKAFPLCAGPQLASWARVIYLGPYFPLVWSALQQPHTQIKDFLQWPLQPATPYLLLQEFKGVRLEKITPLLADCLLQCLGEKPWDSIVAEVIQRHPECDAQSDTETLKHAAQAYLQAGILLRSS